MEPRVTAARSWDELAAFVEVNAAVSPDPSPSVEALEHELATSENTVFLLASVGGAPVATGVGKPSSIAGCLYAMARVVPAYRRRGIGSAVYASLSDHARAIGRSELVGRVRAHDAAAVRFVRAHGFREISREHPVALDLRRFVAAATAPPPGVELHSLAARPELARAAYEVERETIVDIPLEEPLVAAPFEEWRAQTLDGPDALPGGCFVAVADGEVVGWAGLAAVDRAAGAAENLLTAVRRPWRGRGIARALKEAQARWAREAGFERIATTNDEANAPMRAVNARLGYEPEPTWLLVRGPLAPGR